MFVSTLHLLLGGCVSIKIAIHSIGIVRMDPEIGLRLGKHKHAAPSMIQNSMLVLTVLLLNVIAAG